MGTQQILLIVLSVIIVGIAVAVGITMFNAQATNSNRSAIIGDMNNLAVSALAFYKTPTSHGGGQQSFVSTDAIGAWAGYDYEISPNPANTCSSGNGTYLLSISGIAATDSLTIVGTGTELGNDGTNKVKATLTVSAAHSPTTTIGN